VIYFGTSGFSYVDWVGKYYPREMPRNQWLNFYSREFNTLELNSTYYAIVKPSVIEAMIDKTGEGFLFAVKAHQSISHEREGEVEDFDNFTDMLNPFIRSRKLACVLVQFPYSFRNNIQNRKYVEMVRDKFKDFPLVVEFRNAYWIKPEIFGWLQSLNIGFCCVDEPRLPNLIPPVAEITSEIAYIRFHGRNSLKWWQPEKAYERYDYSYSPEELKEWVPGIKTLKDKAEKTFVFANNHWKAQSIDTIRQMRLLLE
jgi:uncharacterized protein YecE (DUF72 family)